MDHDCQMSPKDGAEAHIIDINSSSWEHLHHLGKEYNPNKSNYIIWLGKLAQLHISWK